MVIDTDGSAFITKAEFDSLKNNFQAQIDNYNSSIDSKIDGAIASYLAGIKISSTNEESFFNGAGERLVIVNSEKNSKMHYPKPKLSFTLTKSTTQSAYSNSECYAGTIMMKRDYTDDGEAFRVNNGNKFLYYSKDYNFSLIITHFDHQWYNGQIGWIRFAPELQMKWRGYWSNSAKDSWVWNDNSNTNGAQRSHKPRSMNYIQMSVVGFWFDMIYGSNSVNSPIANYNPTANENPGTLIYWINDSTTQTGTAALKATWLDTGPLEYDFLANLDEIATEGWDATAANGYVYDYPDQAGITTTCAVAMNTKVGTTTTETAGYDSLRWVGNGTYSSTNESEYDTLRPSPTVNSSEWWEPLPTLSRLNSKNIVNTNFSSSQLSEFSAYGFEGKVTQGLPLSLFKKAGSVEFDLDTTGIGGSVILALKTSPFDCTTTAIHNTPLTTGIKNLKLDGATVSGGAMTLSQGVHRISFDVEGDFTINKVPVFFMFGYPASLTETPRYIVTLPKTFQFTVEN